MADIAQYQMDLVELAKIFIQKEGIKDGLWTIGFNFGISQINAGESIQAIRPGMAFVVDKVMLTRSAAPAPLTVDASTLELAVPAV